MGTLATDWPADPDVRIPVKIVIDADQPGADRLRSGMSVVATIKTEQ